MIKNHLSKKGAHILHSQEITINRDEEVLLGLLILLNTARACSKMDQITLTKEQLGNQPINCKVAGVDIITNIVEMMALRLTMKTPAKELRLIFSERSWRKRAKKLEK